jgi:predicted nuclease of predicted toxin-antitoxin system
VSVPLYMDEHVPRAITNALRSRGCDVLTAQDDGAAGFDDDVLIDRATAAGRVVFTQDDDFLREACNRQRAGVPFSGVVYVHQLKLTIGQRVNELELIAKLGEPDEFANRVEFL